MREQVVGLITPMMALIFMSVFLVLWQRGRLGNYVLGFAVSYFFFALGFCVTHFSAIATPTVFLVTQALYSLGAACIIWGATTRVGGRTPFALLATTYLAAAATLATATTLTTSTGPWLQIANAGYGIMFVIGVVALMGAGSYRILDKLIVVVFALSALDFLIRPTLTLLVEQNITAAEYKTSVYYSLINLVLVVKSVITACVLIGACASDQMHAIRLRSETDPLTGMRNRRAFETDLMPMLARAREDGRAVTLVIADLDHFKRVNDAFGHQAGDRALAAFGEVLRKVTRADDVVGRVGGEEFCLALWNCDRTKALAIVDRIRGDLEVCAIEGLPEGQRVTASFGIAERHDGEGYGKLFSRADAALYEAKSSGRDCSRVDETVGEAMAA